MRNLLTEAREWIVEKHEWELQKKEIEMKTVKFEIQDLLGEPLKGEPTLVNEERINRLQKAVLLIAERIDIMYSNQE